MDFFSHTYVHIWTDTLDVPMVGPNGAIQLIIRLLGILSEFGTVKSSLWNLNFYTTPDCGDRNTTAMVK